MRGIARSDFLRFNHGLLSYSCKAFLRFLQMETSDHALSQQIHAINVHITEGVQALAEPRVSKTTFIKYDHEPVNVPIISRTICRSQSSQLLDKHLNQRCYPNNDRANSLILGELVFR